MKLLLKILLSAPMLRWLGEKTNGWKTKIGLVGIVMVLIAHLINAIHPGVIPPELVSDASLDKILDALLCGFGALTAGGGAHKIVKKRRATVEEKDLKRETEMDNINQRMEKLRAEIKERSDNFYADSHGGDRH